MEKAELEAQNKALADENDLLKKDAPWIEAGKAYHAALLEEITKAYGLLKQDPAPMVKLLTNADVETLKEHRDGLLKQIDEKFPPSPVSKVLGEGADPAPLPEGTKKPPQPFDPLASVRGAY